MKELRERRKQLRKDISELKKLPLDQFIDQVDNGLLAKINELKSIESSIQLIVDSKFMEYASSNK